MPRSLAKPEEPIQSIDLHAFGDASAKGVSATVFAVVQQPSGSNQGLLTAKLRLSKKGLTIPRLELVSGHMAANLVHNVKKALEGFPVNRVVGWLDSSVALHWIRGNGEYKQFVGNRVRKIQEKSYIEWRHVGTHENPADIASRGGNLDQSSNLDRVDRARLAVKPREMATKYRDTHHRGNSSRSQNSERVVRCSSTRRRQTRQYHGEVRLLESNTRHSLGVSICAQHEKCPQKQSLGTINYSGDKQTSATVGEASASKMRRNRELQRR